MNWKTDGTIAAIATPIGVGGIGVIRVSGPEAPAMVDRLFKPGGAKRLADAPSHLMLHGWLEKEGRTIDEVMVVHMKAPHSYTCEEVVEVHCHGGVMAMRSVLQLICDAGARPAEAGEFTFRAFLNGRLDLTQVEAVADLVRTDSRLGLQVSVNQLRGRLHDAIQEARDDLTQVAALVAASIDFPEEDVVFTQRGDCLARLAATRDRLAALLATAEQGRILRDGLVVAIVGKPNVGKSSLLNTLLKEERAIVTEIPGTTRDTLEETVDLGGLALRLVDTAGIRDTVDPIEREGVSRSRKAIGLADLTLLLLDGSEPLTGDDIRLLELVDPAKSVLVINKRDLMSRCEPEWVHRIGGQERVIISALTGLGITDLEEWIVGWALHGERPVVEAAMITNLRQQHAAQRALEAVLDAIAALENGAGEELLAVDLARALEALGDIVGETTAEDLLSRIFAEFCIGK